MEKHELKPCPFCGGKAIIDEYVQMFGHGDFVKCHYVECERCMARSNEIPEFRFSREVCIDKAVMCWNRRAEEE